MTHAEFAEKVNGLDEYGLRAWIEIIRDLERPDATTNARLAMLYSRQCWLELRGQMNTALEALRHAELGLHKANADPAMKADVERAASLVGAVLDGLDRGGW